MSNNPVPNIVTRIPYGREIIYHYANPKLCSKSSRIYAVGLVDLCEICTQNPSPESVSDTSFMFCECCGYHTLKTTYEAWRHGWRMALGVDAGNVTSTGKERRRSCTLGRTQKGLRVVRLL